MRIAIGSDRRGYACKTRLISHLEGLGHSVVDVGPHDDTLPVDYPIYGEKVGKLVSSGRCKYGVVVCATGVGIMIAANKVRGVRCGMAYSDDVARLMREHNNANVVAFGQDHMKYSDIERRLDIFLNSDFIGGYHDARVEQLRRIEEELPLEQSPILNTAFNNVKGAE